MWIPVVVRGYWEVGTGRDTIVFVGNERTERKKEEEQSIKIEGGVGVGTCRARGRSFQQITFIRFQQNIIRLLSTLSPDITAGRRTPLLQGSSTECTKVAASITARVGSCSDRTPSHPEPKSPPPWISDFVLTKSVFVMGFHIQLPGGCVMVVVEMVTEVTVVDRSGLSIGKDDSREGMPIDDRRISNSFFTSHGFRSKVNRTSVSISPRMVA